MSGRVYLMIKETSLLPQTSPAFFPKKNKCIFLIPWGGHGILVPSDRTDRLHGAGPSRKLEMEGQRHCCKKTFQLRGLGEDLVLTI